MPADIIESRPTGFAVSASRFVETWFLVVFGGPITYADHDLPPRYAAPGEFVFIVFLVTAIASLGFGVLFRHAGDTGLSAASSATLAGSMLAASSSWIVWSLCTLIAAKLVRANLPLTALWRTAAYSTAPTVAAFPIAALWQASLSSAYPSYDFGDAIWFKLPTIAVAAWSFGYFFISVVRNVRQKRRRFAIAALVMPMVFGSSLAGTAHIPSVAKYVAEKSGARFYDWGPLFVWDKRLQAWKPGVTVTPGEGITVLLHVNNTSEVTARNVAIWLRAPAYDHQRGAAVISARVTCNNCDRDAWTSVEILMPPNTVLQLGRIDARSPNSSEPIALPGAHPFDDLRTSSAIVGDMLPGRHAGFDIYADYDVIWK